MSHPPSLKGMAQRTCIRNIAALKDVGDMSYELVRPILKRVDNPQQLREIEINSPHIADHDAELWKAFLERDIPGWRDKMVEPKNPRSWWKVYRKLYKEDVQAKEEQEQQLKAQMMGIDKRKEENRATYLQKVIREPIRQLAFVDGNPNPNVRCLGNMVQVKQPTLKNAKTGSDVMGAIRRQAVEARKIKALGQTQPAKALLPPAKSQIMHAPASVVMNMAKEVTTPAARGELRPSGARKKSPPATKVVVSRDTQNQNREIANALQKEQAQKEDRLKALTSTGAAKRYASSPPAAATRPTPTTSQSPPADAQPRPLAGSPGRTEEPRTALAVAAEERQRFSPSPAPLVKKRPRAPVSIFMPTKKRKV